MDVSVLLLLGLLAGALTTLAGMGGGLVLTLALAALTDPATALATAAPALLIGNLHRVALYFKQLDRRVGLVAAAAALPGSVIGGLLMSALSETVLRWLLLGTAAFAVARRLGLFSFRPGPKLLAPAAFASGAITATTGGGGLLITPLLLSAGLTGETFVVTTSTVAVAMHIGRIGAYGAAGLVTAETLTSSAVLALAIPLGNLLGKRLRTKVAERHTMNLTWLVLLLSVTLTLAGLH